jgi:hypothetical protein
MRASTTPNQNARRRGFSSVTGGVGSFGNVTGESLSDTAGRFSLTPIVADSYADCVRKTSFALLSSALPLLSLMGAACDQPVSHDPVQSGDVVVVKRALPVNTLGGPIGGPDPVPIDCNTDGCATTGNPCQDYVCNTATGSCVLTNYDGTACDDGNACTSGTTCSKGSCGGGTAVTCQAQDQCHDVGTCDATTGKCSSPAKQDGTGCNDANACTTGDACKSGICQGNAVVCTASDQCHMPGTCNSNDGTCSNPAKADSSGCDDQNACTHSDSCQGGVCKGGNAVVCTASDQCHDVGICDTVSGLCSNPVKPVGFACNDNNLCTYGDACDATGACAGTTLSCVSDTFATRSCNGTQTCTVVPKAGAACDDHNPCTKGDVLDSAGNCAGMAYACPVTDCLTGNACDGQGGCVPVAKPDGTDCDADHNKCTPADRCKAGVCVRDPNPVTCVPKDCNSAACNPATGNCEYTPSSGTTCGVTGCYTMGTCSNGKCSGTPKDCSAMNSSCAEGICDATTGQCMAAPKPNGTSCDPGGKCGMGAQCAFGTCELAAATCPASTSACKVPSCDPATGACMAANKPAGSSCDPQTACAGLGVCDDNGECIGAPAPNGDPCTTKGGDIGLCAAGMCVASQTRSGADGGTDAAGTGGGDDGSVTNPPKTMNPASSGCCALAADPSGGSARAGGLLVALAALQILLARRRRPR